MVSKDRLEELDALGFAVGCGCAPGRGVQARLGAAKPLRLLPATALLRGIALGAGAVHAARAGAVAQATALAIAFALHLAPAFALTQPRAFSSWAAIRADATVLFQAFRLPGGTLFRGLGWTTVTLALTTRAGAGAILGEGRAGSQQAGDGDDCEDVELHNCLLSCVCCCRLWSGATWCAFPQHQTARR